MPTIDNIIKPIASGYCTSVSPISRAASSLSAYSIDYSHNDSIVENDIQSQASSIANSIEVDGYDADHSSYHVEDVTDDDLSLPMPRSASSIIASEDYSHNDSDVEIGSPIPALSPLTSGDYGSHDSLSPLNRTPRRSGRLFDTRPESTLDNQLTRHPSFSSNF